MRWAQSVSALRVCSLSALLFIVHDTFAQTPPAPAASSGEVVMTKLFPPVYPALARQARITTDVKIKLLIRPDGTVESAELVSGHPMFVPVALESARKSLFECHGCSGEHTSYLLTYAFELKNYGDCCRAALRVQEVAESPGLITIVAPQVCLCDPAVAIKRVRSARCLYLWKCGVRDLAVE